MSSVHRLTAVLGVVLVAVGVSGPIAGGQADDPRLTVVAFVNTSSLDIHQLYVAPADRPAWGPDQLEGGIIASGQSIALQGLRCDDYRIRIVAEDGTDCVVAERALCDQARVVFNTEVIRDCRRRAKAAVVTLVNDSRRDLRDLFLSSSTSGSWGEDRLGDGALAPGGRLGLGEVECRPQALRLVDSDGTECVLSQVEMCAESGEWHLTDEMLDRCEETG